MTGLDSQDCTGRGQVLFVHNLSGSSKVGCYTDPFKDAGKCHEGLGVGGREAVFELVGRNDTSPLECTRDEIDMGLLVLVDDLQVAVEGILETRLDKGRLRVVGKTFLVELALKEPDTAQFPVSFVLVGKVSYDLLQCECVVQDNCIVDLGSSNALLDRRGGAQACG